MRHIPVLLKEVVEALHLGPGKHVIDATLGDAGHAVEILQHTGPDGRLIGIDADPEAVLRAQHVLHEYGERVTVVRSNFVELKKICEDIDLQPDGILMDLGWSTPQFEERGRGFSFRKDEPLDMRFSPADIAETAEDIIAYSSCEKLTDIFHEFGEEALSKQIAKQIAAHRKKEPIKTTAQLATVVEDVYKKNGKFPRNDKRAGKIHPATKVFQALRIAVNSELEVLKHVIPDALECLSPGGRLAIISFHSLEDRIVKHAFKKMVVSGLAKAISKKPFIASEEELTQNTKARSAKLRVIEKI